MNSVRRCTNGWVTYLIRIYIWKHELFRAIRSGNCLWYERDVLTVTLAEHLPCLTYRNSIGGVRYLRYLLRRGSRCTSSLGLPVLVLSKEAYESGRLGLSWKFPISKPISYFFAAVRLRRRLGLISIRSRCSVPPSHLSQLLVHIVVGGL